MRVGVALGPNVETIVEGTYHIDGTGVVLRSKPDAASAAIATLRNGETVHAFGDTERDYEHTFGERNVAVKSSSQYLVYARVGTESHGAGWVAIDFLEPGEGSTPTPKGSSAPLSTMSPRASLLFNVAVVATLAGGAYLLWRMARK